MTTDALTLTREQCAALALFVDALVDWEWLVEDVWVALEYCGLVERTPCPGPGGYSQCEREYGADTCDCAYYTYPPWLEAATRLAKREDHESRKAK